MTQRPNPLVILSVGAAWLCASAAFLLVWLFLSFGFGFGGGNMAVVGLAWTTACLLSAELSVTLGALGTLASPVSRRRLWRASALFAISGLLTFAFGVVWWFLHPKGV
jgi:hypothetical protein